jgi:hypothetical protein
MKVTALILFLILLIVLVVSVIIGKNVGSLWKEGFVTYQESVSAGNSFVLPTYSSSNTVTKLFDNLFFDQKNGNIIEIDSPQFQVGGTIDLAGSSIISTTVTTRDNNISSNQYNGNVSLLPNGGTTSTSVPESQIGSVSINYNSYIYNSISTNTDTYCVLYMPWYTNTYIHILDLTANAHVGTFSQNNGKFYSKYYSVDGNNVPNASIGLSQIPFDISPNDNSFVSDEYYDPNKILYQVSQYVKYDITNGSLIVRTANGASVYSRTSPITSANYLEPYTTPPSNSTVTNIPFAPSLIADNLGNNVILYIPDGTNTLVAVISLQNTAIPGKQTANYTLSNVVRFTANTVDNGSSVNSNTGIMGLFNSYIGNFQKTIVNPDGSPYMGPMMMGPIMDMGPMMGVGPMMGPGNGMPYMGPNGGVSYWQQGVNPYWQPPIYGMHNAQGSNKNNSSYSDDYILKTQIVPPVCPSCPSCPSGSGVCNSCGGKGGCGTKANNGNTMVNGKNPSTFFGEGSPNTGTTDEKGNKQQWVSNIGSGTFSSNADPNTIAGGLTLMQYDAVAGIEDVAKTGAGVVTGVTDSLGSVAKTGLTSVTGVANNAISSVAGLAKGNNQGSTGNNNYGGSMDYHGSEGTMSGASSSTGSRQGPSVTGGQGSGTGGISYSGPQSMDQYSYYGALPAKGSANYMPVTADFSSFRH